jgi:hypothetical protein
LVCWQVLLLFRLLQLLLLLRVAPRQQFVPPLLLSFVPVRQMKLLHLLLWRTESRSELQPAASGSGCR